MTVAPANRIALHRHPGAELLYVVRGHARVLGAAGVAPEKLDEGMAIYIPPSMPHAIENMGRSDRRALLLEVFVPPGPGEGLPRPRGPGPAARAGSRSLHDPGVASHRGRQDSSSPRRPPRRPCLSSVARARRPPLLDVAHTGNRAVYLGKLEVEPGVEVPRHCARRRRGDHFRHRWGERIEGGERKIPFRRAGALYIPAGQPHAVKFTGTDKAELVQIYAPAGPEDPLQGTPRPNRRSTSS